MASLMDQFEQQYSVQTAEITAKIGKLVRDADTPSCDSEELHSQYQAIEALCAEVNDLLDQMELSVREMAAGSAERKKYEQRVQSYRRDKQALDKEVTKAHARLERAELMTGSSGESSRLNETQRQQLISNTETLERSSRKLEDTHRLTVETEEIGAGILRDLSDQRATIQRSRNRLADAQHELGQSGQLLNRMIARVIQNRVMVIAVIAALIITAVIMFYTMLS